MSLLRRLTRCECRWSMSFHLRSAALMTWGSSRARGEQEFRFHDGCSFYQFSPSMKQALLPLPSASRATPFPAAAIFSGSTVNPCCLVLLCRRPWLREGHVLSNLTDSSSPELASVVTPLTRRLNLWATTFPNIRIFHRSAILKIERPIRSISVQLASKKDHLHGVFQ